MSIDPNIATIIVAVILGVGTIIGARYSAAGGISEAAMKLINPLKDRITDLEKLTKSQGREIRDLIRGVTILTSQLKTAGIKPQWVPTPVGELETGQGD
jgi:hypothetical protein